MRHEEEEKRAKQMLREEEGTGRKGRLGIDLESGVVVIGSDKAGGQPAPAGGDSNGDGRDSSERDGSEHSATDDRPDPNAADTASGTAGETRKNGHAAKPGEPQVARRSPGAAPQGKARRRGGPGTGSDSSGSPVGKARRTPR